jgi:Icc-related predicted phosphoesterase
VKFLNAVKYNIYKAHIVMLSGDLTGKAIIPIVRKNGEYLAKTLKILGVDERAKSEDDLADLRRRIRNAGFYPHVFDESELEELDSNRSKLETLFTSLMSECLERWVRMAEEQLPNSGVKCIMMPGNDDLKQADDIIRKSNYVCNPEGLVIELDGHEMISSGFSNPTPWRTPRECSEEELEKKIDGMVIQVKNMKNCIFNFHVPPYDSTLDVAPLLDANLRPVVTATKLLEVPVGSKAVRAAVEKYQPLLGLHGHIHDSASEVNIGRTLCLNPGSLYQQGILRGYIIDLESGKIKLYQRVEG